MNHFVESRIVRLDKIVSPRFQSKNGEFLMIVQTLKIMPYINKLNVLPSASTGFRNNPKTEQKRLRTFAPEFLVGHTRRE